MNTLKLFAGLFLLCLPVLACTPASSATPILKKEIFCGLNFVAPPSPFAQNPIPAVQKIGANWIAVCPFAYTRQNTNWVRYDSKWQWWGEKPEGVRRSIELAHEAGVKVLLKPHVYIPGSWPGDLAFESEQDWLTWEADYTEYIMEFVQIAQEMNVEMFCIGVEFKKSVVQRTAYWKDLIQQIRSVYNGPLTYASNWDAFTNVPFWKDLDYVGIDAYFPLVDAHTPKVNELKKAWRPHLEKIKKVHEESGKPILFTEFGYLAVDGCAHNTWELEARVHSIPLNEQAQANAYEALFSVFWDEPFWHGGFLWKWFPNMQGHEGYPAKDYTPQGKLSEDTIEKWYKGKI